MTRLTTAWIKDIEQTAGSKSKELKEKTGLDFLSLAAAVSAKTPGEITEAAKSLSVAVVPVTTGLGLIGSFAQSVAAIIKQMGFQSFVTGETDVAGLYESKEKKADIVFLADDNRYIALNLNKKGFAENDFAVAKGYTILLDAFAKKQHGFGLYGKQVLLLGYSRVGKRMEQELLAMGANVTIYDKDPQKQKEIRNNKGSQLQQEKREIKNFLYIADATNQGGWITKEMLAPGTLIAAPGIPFSLDEEAQIAYERFSIHDKLEIGTVAMLALVLE